MTVSQMESYLLNIPKIEKIFNPPMDKQTSPPPIPNSKLSPAELKSAMDNARKRGMRAPRKM